MPSRSARCPSAASNISASPCRSADELLDLSRLDAAVELVELALGARGRDDRAGLESLAAFESGLRARARVVVARPRGDALELVATGRLRRAGRGAIAVARRDERLRWELPPELAPTLDEDNRDVTGALDGQVGLVLRSRQDQTEWPLTVTSTTHVPTADGPTSPVFPRLKGRARIDPEDAAGGAALRPARYDSGTLLSIRLAPEYRSRVVPP